MQDKTLDMHKLDVDIPDNLGAGQAVDGRQTVATSQNGCVQLFTVTVVISEPASDTGRHNSIVNITSDAYERLYESALL